MIGYICLHGYKQKRDNVSMDTVHPSSILHVFIDIVVGKLQRFSVDLCSNNSDVQVRLIFRNVVNNDDLLGKRFAYQ